MYGLGMVLSESYLTLLLVRFGTEGLLKAGISSRFHAKHPTKYSACWKSGAKIRKIFGICKFFDAKKEEKWKKMGKMKKAELSLLVMDVILLGGASSRSRRQDGILAHKKREHRTLMGANRDD